MTVINRTGVWISGHFFKIVFGFSGVRGFMELICVVLFRNSAGTIRKSMVLRIVGWFCGYGKAGKDHTTVMHFIGKMMLMKFLFIKWVTKYVTTWLLSCSIIVRHGQEGRDGREISGS